MAQSKDDIKYGTAQAKVSPDEALRVAYVGGTPLESGKIAYSESVDLFSAAHNIATAREQGNQGKPADAQTTGKRDDESNRH